MFRTYHIFHLAGRYNDALLQIRLWRLQFVQAVTSFLLHVRFNAGSRIADLDRFIQTSSLSSQISRKIYSAIDHRPRWRTALWSALNRTTGSIIDLAAYRALAQWARDNGIRADEVQLSHGRGFKWVWRNESKGKETHWVGMFDSITDAYLDAQRCNGVSLQVNGESIRLVVNAVLAADRATADQSKTAPEQGGWRKTFSPADLAIITGLMLTHGPRLSDEDFPSGPLLHNFFCGELAQSLTGYCGGKLVDVDGSGNVVIESDEVLSDRQGVWRFAGIDSTGATAIH